jgi:flagellar hook-associated protein 3 FlgL
MRVTNNMLTQNLLRNLENANSRMELIQNQLSSGQAITRPSDDPVGIETALRLKSTISSMEQWKNNTSEALTYMETTESIMNNLTTMLQRIRELTVKGADGSNSLDDRAQIAKEIDQLTLQFRVMANSQVSGKYIFSGTLINKAPLDDYFGTDIPPLPPEQWNGNGKVMEFETGPNVNIPISISGMELFEIYEDTGTAPSTMQSKFFNTLNQLSQALYDDDTDDINNALDEIDDHMDNFLKLRSELGARTNRMYVIADQLDNSINIVKKNLSNIQDVDMAGAIMEFKSVENVFRAALAVGAQIIQPSLVDFMR